MKITEIAAVGKNGELGKDNQLIWHIKEDMRFFQKQTKGHPVVMGRKTFDSLPGLLSDRHHIVISRSHPDVPKEVDVYESVDAFLEAYRTCEDEVFVIGGAQIYALLLPYADRLLLTEIDEGYKADAYFPSFDPDQYARRILASGTHGELSYIFVEYRKK